jgi:hypothetical protein
LWHGSCHMYNINSIKESRWLQPLFKYQIVNPHPFTLPELDSIRQVTLAKVICDNTDITSLPRDVFLLPNPVT